MVSVVPEVSAAQVKPSVDVQIAPLAPAALNTPAQYAAR
jgi:hypothetical protein